ncbi:gliding motility lipoprotein GldD [Aestuariivivens sediminis]|uniref:gliding motility lipoprotein GldD n=1 Tax=Aestuariivivens sediminis TaxID=2913557 RepID=UPI001F59081D|nr:gliding motility lipoprotein GldD [Aestuariivivens sediminis]
MCHHLSKGLLIINSLVFISCGENAVPKPRAYLRLEYPEAKYIRAEIDLPFTFEKNNLSTKQHVRKVEGTTPSYGIDLGYPTMKGTIYLTYKAIEGSRENLIAFLKDAQNFTQKHTIKADEIKEQAFVDNSRKVYGMLYEVGGNAASQSQFYVTDSTDHFLTGSLYFYAKPNYDSILPAAHYLKQDIKHIMETVRWK